MHGINTVLSKKYAQAKAEGRVCSRCGWIVTKKDAAHGFTMCASCRDALHGVNVHYGRHAPAQEPDDITGDAW